MSDRPENRDPGDIWRDQPAEQLPVDLQQIAHRRTEDLSSSTRWEILTSIGAAVVLIGVIAWRLRIFHEDLLEIGIAAALAWMAISLYWFRRRIWRRDTSQREGLAATCLEYYRAELERRRAHLKNEWLWHGPLALALMMFVFVFLGRVNIAFQPLRNVLPLLVLLALWTGFGIWRRRLQVKQLQREIDELGRLGAQK